MWQVAPKWSVNMTLPHGGSKDHLQAFALSEPAALQDTEVGEPNMGADQVLSGHINPIHCIPKGSGNQSGPKETYPFLTFTIPLV